MSNIRTLIKRFLILISLVLSIQITLPGHEAHAAYDSMLEYENQRHYDGFFDFVLKVLGDIYNCFIKNIVFNTGQFNQTCIPRLISSDVPYEDDCRDSKNHDDFIMKQTIGTIIFIAAIVATIALTWIPIIGQLAWIIVGAAIIHVIVTCLSSFVLAPHEYINAVLGYVKCEWDGGEIRNVHKKALTPADVPFFYTCLDHETPRDITLDPNWRSRLDIEYGNMTGPSMPYCQAMNADYAINSSSLAGKSAYGISVNNLTVSSIIVWNVGFWNMITRSSGYCDVPADSIYTFNISEIRGGSEKGGILGLFKTLAFYRLNSGKIQLCSATGTMAAAMINGCTYIAPPIQMITIDAGYTEGTRCQYFLSSRSDLNSLGSSLVKQARAANNTGDPSNTIYPSVGLFLQSDLHITSTIVGCIQDLLAKVVVGSSNDKNSSLLFKIQNIMSPIIKAVLILYVSLLGIKIMSSPQPPQMGEVVMYILKFGVVVVLSGLAGPKIWYDDKGMQGDGLYPLLLKSINDLSSRVLQSTVKVSPVNMCYENYNGSNLLSERALPVSQLSAGGNVFPTKSLIVKPGYIQLSVWDFIDCKLISYINLNSCKYTISGIICLWLVSICIFFPTAILLGIVTIIFCIVLFTNMMRFVHLAIISMFALTILVLVSPIMCCFILFEYTKQTFESWFKMMLGYLLYPAVVFAFAALMIATFDSIFYGIPQDKSCLTSSSCKLSQICDDKNNSIYCAIANSVYTDIAKDDSKISKDNIDPKMCNIGSGTLLTALTTYYPIKLLGITIFNIRSLKEVIFDVIFQGLLKMMLFAILFDKLTTSVIGFLEALLSIFGISGTSVDFSAKAKAAVKKAIGGAVSGGGK